MKSVISGVILALSLMMATPSLLPAQTPSRRVVVEAHRTGLNYESYRELSGKWIDSDTRSSAEDLRGTSTRKLTAADGKLSGKAEFRPVVPTVGLYEVYISWPANANALGVTVSFRGAGSATPLAVNFTPLGVTGSLANTWVRLGEFQLSEGAGFSIIVDGDSATGPADVDRPFELAIAGVRLVSLSTGSDMVGENPFAVDRSAADTAGQAEDQGIRFTNEGMVGDDAASAGTIGSTTPSSNPTPRPDAGEGTTTISTPSFPAATNDPAAIPADPFSGAAGPAPTMAPPVPTTAPANTGTTGGAAIPTDPFGQAPPPPVSITPAADPFSGAAPAVTAAPPANPSAVPADPFGGAAPIATAAPPANPSAVPADPFDGAAPVATAVPPPVTNAPADPFSGTTPVASNPLGEPEPTTPSNPFTDPTPLAAENPFAGNGAATSPASGGQPVTRIERVAPDFVPPTDAAIVPPVSSNPPAVVPVVPTPTVAPVSRVEMMTDFDAAVKKGQFFQKPVVILFVSETAASNRYEENIIGNADVQNALARHTVVVRLDARVHEAIADRFSVRRAPYVVVLDRYGHTKAHITEMQKPDRFVRSLLNAIQ